jgi:hypothetical protein
LSIPYLNYCFDFKHYIFNVHCSSSLVKPKYCFFTHKIRFVPYLQTFPWQCISCFFFIQDSWQYRSRNLLQSLDCTSSMMKAVEILVRHKKDICLRVVPVRLLSALTRLRVPWSTLIAGRLQANCFAHVKPLRRGGLRDHTKEMNTFNFKQVLLKYAYWIQNWHWSAYMFYIILLTKN